jgi:hypothetical protein
MSVNDFYKGEPKIRIPPSDLAAYGTQLTEAYYGMRALFLLDDRPSAQNSLVLERYPDGRPRRLSSRPGTELVVDEYDWEGHALRLHLQGQGWRASMHLREYKPE